MSQVETREKNEHAGNQLKKSIRPTAMLSDFFLKRIEIKNMWGRMLSVWMNKEKKKKSIHIYYSSALKFDIRVD